MKSDNRFQLYRHIRPDTDTPFYIGIGNKRRAIDFHTGRNAHWLNIYNLNNGNIEVETLLDNLTWEEVRQQEIWWIAFYGRSDLGKGPLCNLTDGGEGAYGRIKSAETITKFKASMSKREHPMKGKTHTPEARARIAEAGRTRVWTPEMKEKSRLGNIGRVKSLQERKNISEGKKGKSTAGKQVINIETGEIYKSVKDAVKVSGYKKSAFFYKLTGNKPDINFKFKYLHI
jgi:hypothetical protein